MKYALVDNQKVEAKKGLKGICQYCHQPLFSKCGPIRIDHWAHKRGAQCDKWWENETEWHRLWKNKFPEEWQEVIAIDEKTGEHHIADIKTNEGMVIEFQHSYISDEERISRENFYKNMIWIVDGTRRKNDFDRFRKADFNHDIYCINEKDSRYVLARADHYLPKEWLNSSVPVFIDFNGTSVLYEEEYDDPISNPILCLLPETISSYRVLLSCEVNNIIKMIRKGGFIIEYEDIYKDAKNGIGSIRYYRSKAARSSRYW